MRYIDSNIFIYPIIADEHTEVKSSSAKKLLLRIATGELDAVTSYLTWDEFVWVLKKFMHKDIAASEGRKFLAFPNLRFVSIDGMTVKRAQDLIEKYSINPRDAIHAACALENGISEFVSDDPDFDKVKELTRIRLSK
jgi:predicted nucleic acid-binding protein